jgi:hypothetical protein
MLRNDLAEHPGALCDRDDDAVNENRGTLQSRSSSETREVSRSEDAGSSGEDAGRRGKDGDVAVGSPEFRP